VPREWRRGEVCREARVHLVLQRVVHRLGEPRSRTLEHLPPVQHLDGIRAEGRIRVGVRIRVEVRVRVRVRTRGQGQGQG